MQSMENESELKKETEASRRRYSREDIYKKLAIAATVIALIPMQYFINHNVLHTPEPIAEIYLGTEHQGLPIGDTYDIYDYQWVNPGDEYKSIFGFIAGLVAAIAAGLVFYSVLRVIADPIMYKIDIVTNSSDAFVTIKVILVGFIGIIYVAAIFFAWNYDKYPNEDYVWLMDSNGTKHRVNKKDYEMVMEKKEKMTESEKEREREKNNACW